MIKASGMINVIKEINRLTVLVNMIDSGIEFLSLCYAEHDLFAVAKFLVCITVCSVLHRNGFQCTV